MVNNLTESVPLWFKNKLLIKVNFKCGLYVLFATDILSLTGQMKLFLYIAIKTLLIFDSKTNLLHCL